LDLGAHRLWSSGPTPSATSDRPGRHEGKAPDLIDGALHLLEGRPGRPAC
jgi:hypothetical protein